LVISNLIYQIPGSNQFSALIYMDVGIRERMEQVLEQFPVQSSDLFFDPQFYILIFKYVTI